MGLTKKLDLASLNGHLICVLCSGYYVEATTIVECLHTFCRSCIVKYVQTNNFCPICDVQINQSKPWSSLRSDKTMQDLVYKLVPGLYHDEMERRRQFYTRLGEVDVDEGEEKGFLPQGARFFSQDDSISLSLEYYSRQDEEGYLIEENYDHEIGSQKNDTPKRYLQCPAAVTVRHLKKFLRMKYGIGIDCWVDIIYDDECLPEAFTLIDVAYSFIWNRTSPMRFSYRIFSKAIIRAFGPKRNLQSLRLDEGEGKKSKHETALEQQKQNEYLGNFNLNPTKSDFLKSQNYSNHKSNSNCDSKNNINNNNNSVKNNNAVTEKKHKKDEHFNNNTTNEKKHKKDEYVNSTASEKKHKKDEYFNNSATNEKKYKKDEYYNNNTTSEKKQKKDEYFSKSANEKKQKKDEYFNNSASNEKKQKKDEYFNNSASNEKKQKKDEYFNNSASNEKKHKKDEYFNSATSEKKQKKDEYFNSAANEKKQKKDEYFNNSASNEKKQKKDEYFNNSASNEKKQKKDEYFNNSAANEKKHKKDEYFNNSANEKKHKKDEYFKNSANEKKQKKDEHFNNSTNEKKHKKDEYFNNSGANEKKQKKDEYFNNSAANEKKHKKDDYFNNSAANEKKQKKDEFCNNSTANEKKQKKDEYCSSSTANEKKQKKDEYFNNSANEKKQKKDEHFNSSATNEKKQKKDEYFFKDCQESEDGSRDKIFQSSEESNASGLRIVSEKEESLKENSEDSRESIVLREKRKLETPVPNFGEEAVDSFTAKKLLKTKHKVEGRNEKRKLLEVRGEKRRKSAGHAEGFQKKKRGPLVKRRKSMADEFSLKRETFSVCNDDDDSLLNLKNEALRKVFVSKEKPEIINKRKEEEEVIKRQEEEVKKKKRKKSKHHEFETKKRKLEVKPKSSAIMSFVKDPLKLKVKLTPKKPVIRSSAEKETKKHNPDVNEDSDKEEKNSVDDESKKAIADKERLLHLRAVRHKTVISKTSPKEYINAPPSLTISKVDSSEQQPVKSPVVESRPSLEIVLVKPAENTKVKKPEVNAEPRKEPKDEKCQKVESPPAKEVRPKEVVDNFGVLDLSEKSTRTKENSSSSSSPKEVPETVERCRKNPHHSILQIAQTLVNRKLSPILPENHLRGGFDGPADSSTTAVAMRNLKTLSDTAVNILMAAQSKNFPACTESQKSPFLPLVSPPAHKPVSPSNSTKPTKDCENGSGIKIPVYPVARERTTPIPPVPNLHEIFPRGRGRPPLSLNKAPFPAIKPGQNQTVRQIPNPFVVLNRQGHHNQNAMKPLLPEEESPPKPESGEEAVIPVKQKPTAIPPLQSIKTKFSLPKLEDLTDLNSDKMSSNDFKSIVPKIINNNTKTVQNGSDVNIFGMKNGDDKKVGNFKLGSTGNSIRKIESMARNIESVAAGLTARAVSNAMIDAK